MKRKLILCLLLFTTISLQAQLPVGQWRDHLSFRVLNKVETAGERIYASSDNALFYYDIDDYTLQTVSKTHTLNDIGISTFAYDPVSHYLVVAYSNANIDLIKDDKVINLSDIKRSNISGNKKINTIRFNNHCAYLACAFGVVVVDLNRQEIKETYFLGPDGTYANINDIAFVGDTIVAATDNGILSAPKASPYLHIVSNWNRDENSLLAGQTVKILDIAPDGSLLAMTYDNSDGSSTLYRSLNHSFVPWITDTLRTMKVSHQQILVVRDRRLSIFDNNFQSVHELDDIDWMEMNVNDAVLSNDGQLWMAHQWTALAVCDPSNPENSLRIIEPEGPASDNVFRLVSFNDELLVCPGGHTTTYAGVYLPATLYSFKDNRWRQPDDPDHLLNGMYDLIHVAFNPRKPNIKMAATWGSGLVEINDNTVTAHYDQSNSDSCLVPYTEGDYVSLRTGGVAYDRKGNLWAINSKQPYGLIAHYTDGSWKKFNILNMVSGSDIDNILCDSINGLKLFWGHANKIFVHDGENRMAYIDPNNGARLETASVHCLVQDHNGAIWVGTNKGIKVIYDLSKAFQNGGNGEKSPVTCSNILYNENGINEYLLAYENITSIIVDGANRKWVGTNSGGLYLLSANGQKQLEHFTMAETPLFSDKIVALSILPWTGELFIGTDKGLQSYRTTATYAFATPQEDIHAFPNPVRPDYDGHIAIKGFSRNALVHITDAAGHTVFSTTSNGGQAIWNGCTNDGKKVASGVYYVFASSDDGDIRSVTKILIIR